MTDNSEATEFTVPEGKVTRVTYPGGHADLFEAGDYRLEGYGGLLIDQFDAGLLDLLATPEGFEVHPAGSSPAE